MEHVHFVPACEGMQDSMRFDSRLQIEIKNFTRETAWYLYENHVTDKSNFRALGDGVWILFASTIDLRSINQK
jgi:hypothetical protein